MKFLTAPRAVKVPTNCDGPEEVFWDQILEVEAEDVGKTRDNHLGYQHKAYRFVGSDVGRLITHRQQGTDYACWWFNA